LAFGLLTRAAGGQTMETERKRDPQADNEDLDQTSEERIKGAGDEEEFEEIDETEDDEEDLES
jgi:hypothetical protein